MREIKFRVWCEDRGKFFDDLDLISFDYIPEKGFRVMAVEGKEYTFYYAHSGVAVEQYTGLKDAKGKDIYEGDIVRYIDGIKSLVVDFSGNQIVEYDDGSFSPFCGCGGEYSMTPAKTIVVGNIHENSDLVDKNIEKR